MLQQTINCQRFISFEGTEGVGKTTQIKMLSAALKSKAQKVCLTREPGGTILGEKIRDILLTTHNKIYLRTELLLMFAARAEHLEQVILPSLKRGEWVLCDRYIDSSYAYQGGGRGIEMNDINALENLVCQKILPRVTFLLDAPINIGLQRIQLREKLDHFEQQSVDFFKRVRDVYLNRAKKYCHRILLLKAMDTKFKIHRKILKAIHFNDI